MLYKRQPGKRANSTETHDGCDEETSRDHDWSTSMSVRSRIELQGRLSYRANGLEDDSTFYEHMMLQRCRTLVDVAGSRGSTAVA
jgi:hypothetical protein